MQNNFTTGNMLSNIKLQVSRRGKECHYKRLQNGLPQRSVLSPLLFNAYIVDITETFSKKFTYANDVALVPQTRYFAELEKMLNDDLGKINNYFQTRLNTYRQPK